MPIIDKFCWKWNPLVEIYNCLHVLLLLLFPLFSGWSKYNTQLMVTMNTSISGLWIMFHSHEQEQKILRKVLEMHLGSLHQSLILYKDNLYHKYHWHNLASYMKKLLFYIEPSLYEVFPVSCQQTFATLSVFGYGKKCNIL